LKTNEFFIWEGIYPTFREAPGDDRAFREAIWAERSRARALELKDRRRSGGLARVTTASTGYCLPPIVALAQTERARVRLLDFGGSVGFSFYGVVDVLARPEAIEYTVVDNEVVCAIGREVFHDEPRITFQAELPDGAFDVVHCGSSLQYVEHWASTLRTLVASKPQYLVLDDVPAGSIPTFVGLQNYYGKKIPHWFWNADEFVDTVTRATGYELFYKARFIGTFLGKTGPIPMDNFPEDHRIENALNFAFKRRN
jgi:putative methyltransferase (TIGR04325 family)